MNFDSALAGGGIFMIVSNMFNEDLNKILLFSSEQLLDFFFLLMSVSYIPKAR